MATLQFLGATGTVTGSRYLLESGSTRVLVDCGLFQGYKQLRLRNWGPFTVPPSTIDAVVLTHAHLDHSGYLPRLVKAGFRGRVYCTPATQALCGVLLPDSGRLQEEEASYVSRRKYSRHRHPEPLYGEADANDSLERLTPLDFGREQALGREMSCTLVPAGHLLGAAQVRMNVDGRIIHFSGDVGRSDDILMRAPQPFEGADVLVCESTYGNRLHPRSDVAADLAATICRVAERGGVLLIPSFAVGRAQVLLLHIARLRQRGEIPDLPVFVNSPMAQAATRIHERFGASLRLSPEESRTLGDAAIIVRTVEESIALNQRRGPMIIISASGMLTGGRILHHVATFGPDRRNAILLAGFQAGGTRGARLAAGERSLRIFGSDVPIHAEVIALEGLSAHADADGLLRWMRDAKPAPRRVYVTHGEPDSADALRYRIRHELDWAARVPEHLEFVDLAQACEEERG